MNRYRIGIDARFLRKETGGLGRYTQELLHHLAAIDTQNDYFVFITPADEHDWTITASNFHKVVTTALHYSVAEQTKFLQELNAAKLDLMHFTNFNHPLLYRRSFVTTLHDLTVYFNPVGRSQKSQLRRSAFIATLKHSLTGAKAVIAISKNTADDAEEIFSVSPEKIHLVYEAGPDTPSIPRDSRRQVQEFLGTSEPYFLFVSQWRPHKGIITLIEAFDIYKKKTNSTARLILTGKQKVLAEEVRHALERSHFRNDILTPGFVPDSILPSLYTHSLACVVPSEYEGFGLPVLEAFTYKTPVIAADNSSLPEVGGVAALYFPTRDVHALAAQLETIESHPEKRPHLIEAGLQQATNFSWERCARETHAVYMSVLKN